MGRKRKNDRSVTVRLPTDLELRLLKLANQSGETLSQVIRALLEKSTS